MRWYSLAAPKPKDLDWNLFERRIGEGATIGELAHELGANRDTIAVRYKQRYGDPNSPYYNPSMLERAIKNAEEMRSRKIREQWEDPEYREMRSRKTREQWENPEYRETMKKVHEDPEFREMRSRKTREQWENPEYQEMKSKRQKEWWKATGFKEWLSKFPPEKQQQIMTAIRKGNQPQAAQPPQPQPA
jgi:DNA-binding XRE family transcriptional regulator